MSKSLSEALLPPEWRAPRPARRRKPYLCAGVRITCERGHLIGVVAGDLPRRGDDVTPWPTPEIVGVPIEQRFPRVIDGGAAPDFIELGWAIYGPGSGGRCRICGALWMKPVRSREGEIRGFRLHASTGWDGSRKRRRRP